MNYDELLSCIPHNGFPVGVFGCRVYGIEYECCDYDIAIFDEHSGTSIVDFKNKFITIHHLSLNETNPYQLLQIENMHVLQDDQWDLKTLLSKIKIKKSQLENTFVKQSLVESGVCLSKAKNGIDSDVFSPIWLKISSFFIADALATLNSIKTNPTHLLHQLRDLKKNKLNQSISVLTDCLGVERSTTSLLQRMSKSTVGFSDMTQNNLNSKIISQKSAWMIENSLLADCYFYLGYVTRNNFIKVKNLHHSPELIHVLKTALDLETDLTKMKSQIAKLQKTANSILKSLHM